MTRLETPAQVRHQLGWRHAPQAVYLNGERLEEVRDAPAMEWACVTIVFGPIWGRFDLVDKVG